MSDKPKEDYKSKWEKVLDELKSEKPFPPIKKRPKEKLIEIVLTQDIPDPNYKPK